LFYCKAQTLILQLIFSMPTAVAQLHQEHVVSPVCAYLTCIGRIWDFNSFELVEERSIYILYYLSLCVLIYDVWDNHSVLLVASSSVFLSHQISISHQSVLFFSRSKSTPANRTERIDSLIKVLNSLESVRLPLPVGARRRSPWSEMKKMRPFTRWQWVPVAGDALLSIETHRRAATGNTKSREVAGALAGTTPSSTARNPGTNVRITGVSDPRGGGGE